MNATANRIDWTLDDLRNYFGLRLRSRQRSRYLDREPFAPAVLAMVHPKQLHETATHPGGVPVHLEGGVPAMRREVVAMLDGVPYALMRDAVDYLRQFDWEAWRAVQAVMDRYPLDTAEVIAKRLFCEKSTVFKRINRSMETISSFIDRELAQKNRGAC